MTESPRPALLSRAVVAISGCALVIVALIIIWIARLTVASPVYVSALGAEGEPTAQWFEAALLLVVAGGGAVAWAGRDVRSTAWLVGRWTPSVSLIAAAALFLIASQVPCTTGCPLPVGATFTWQDLIHTIAAVLAFAGASVAMLQASFADGRRALRRLSLTAGVAVGVIAGAGGILSLLRVGTHLGSIFELVATTLAIGWLVVFGASVARSTPDRRPDHGRRMPTESYPGTTVRAPVGSPARRDSGRAVPRLVP